MFVGIIVCTKKSNSFELCTHNNLDPEFCFSQTFEIKPKIGSYLLLIHRRGALRNFFRRFLLIFKSKLGQIHSIIYAGSQRDINLRNKPNFVALNSLTRINIKSTSSDCFKGLYFSPSHLF